MPIYIQSSIRAKVGIIDTLRRFSSGIVQYHDKNVVLLTGSLFMLLAFINR